MLDRCLKLYRKNKEIIHYLIVGGLTTVVSLGVYYLCVVSILDPAVDWQLQTANVVSWLAAVTFAYFTNRKFVFASKNSHVNRELGLFGASRLGTLLMDMAIMYAGVSLLGANDKIVKLVVQVVVTVANYIFSKLLVFRRAD